MSQRRVLFRLDDICPQMNRERFQRMRMLFEQYGVQPIIGVVPECKDPELNIDSEDPEFWEMIRTLQKSGWTVAMHGVDHIYVNHENGLISHGFQSEFAGLSEEEQIRKLKRGKQILQEHGIETDVFMAPSHSYDLNTLRALKQCGFRYVTDGLTSVPYRYMGLIFVPCIEPKIKNVKRLSTVCYHTNTIAEQRFAETEAFLSTCGNEVIGFYEAAELGVKDYASVRIQEKINYHLKYHVKPILYRIIKGNTKGKQT